MDLDFGLWTPIPAVCGSALASIIGVWQNLAITDEREAALAEYLTIREVCALLKIGERTIYQLCRTGKLGGAAKVGNQWRVDKTELLAWLRAGGAAEFQESGAEPNGEHP